MGNCACGQKIDENNQYRFDESSEQTIFEKIKEKLSPQDIIIEKIDKKIFEEFIESQDLRDLFDKYEDQINDYAKNPVDQIFSIFPIKMINNKTGEINYYQGGVTIDGYFTGKGTKIVKNRLIYYGNFKYDEYNGKGLMILDEKDYIFGDWVNGVCTGNGELQIKNQLEYKGEFLDNKKNGYGIEKYFNGSRYEGEFKNNIKSGKGKYYLNNGDYYDGNFENDVYNGFGEFKWIEEGRDYKGQFKNGVNEGKGCSHFKDGSWYEGGYKAGLKHGRGTYSWPNGKKIIGNWINNKLHGNAYYEMDGEKYIIIFRFGKIITIQKTNSPPACLEDNSHSSYINDRNNNNVCLMCHKACDNPQQCRKCSAIYCYNCIIDKYERYNRCVRCGDCDFITNPNLPQEDK